METLKNLINPGKKEDDQILYGDGQSSNPTASTTHEPTTSTTIGTGITDTSTDPIGETDNTATAGTTSTTADAFHSGTLGHLQDTPRKNDAVEPTTASTSSTGPTGTSDTAGTTYEETPRQTEPLQSSTAPTTSTHEPVADSALTDTSARNVDAYDNDASSTTAIKGGVPGTTTDYRATGVQDDSYTGAPSSKTQEIADVAALRGEPGTSDNTATGTTATTADSDYYPDTTAEATTTEATTTSDSHLGRDAALGGAALGGAGLAEHEHNKNIENNDTLGSTTTGTGATTTLPDRTADTVPSGGATSKTDETLAIAAGRGERGAQAVEHPGSNNSPLTGGNSSTVTDARGLGDTTDNTANPVSYTGGPLSDSTTDPSYTNPSATDNSTTTTDPLSSTTEPTTTGDSHLGRDAALGGAALGGAGLAEHEHNKNIENNDTLGSTTTGTGAGTVGGPADWEHSHTGHGHTYEGDPCGPGAEPAGLALVDGPHATNTANLLDPHVNTTGRTSDLETTDRHHTERNAALVGGTGLAGAAAYEAEKHESSSAPTSSGAIGAETTDSGIPSSNTTGPVHKSSLLNKLDPRVKQNTTSQAGGAGVIGEGTTDRSGHEYDVADAGGMQGARVAVPYEHEKSDHHYGADAAGGAALGGVAYEAEKHHEKSAAEPTTTGSSQYGGMAPLGIKHHEPEQQSSLVGTGTSSDYPGLEPTGHKFHDPEQPTSLVGTGGTSEYGGMAPKDQAEEKHEEKHKSKGGILGKIFGKKDKSDSHDEKDVVEAGAAGAGTAGVVEHEEHKHEHNKLHKDPPAGYTSGETTYADAPTSGYASQVTGGTGTTALAQGESYPQGSHLTGAGNVLDSGVADESVPASGLGTETEGGPLSSRVNDNGEQLTAGGKYHDAANMGYGEGIKAGPEAALEENRGV